MIKVILQYTISAEMKIRSATEVTQSSNFLLRCLVECYSTSSEEGKP